MQTIPLFRNKIFLLDEMAYIFGTRKPTIIFSFIFHLCATIPYLINGLVVVDKSMANFETILPKSSVLLDV